MALYMSKARETLLLCCPGSYITKGCDTNASYCLNLATTKFCKLVEHYIFLFSADMYLSLWIYVRIFHQSTKHRSISVLFGTYLPHCHIQVFVYIMGWAKYCMQKLEHYSHCSMSVVT